MTRLLQCIDNSANGLGTVQSNRKFTFLMPSLVWMIHDLAENTCKGTASEIMDSASVIGFTVPSSAHAINFRIPSYQA